MPELSAAKKWDAAAALGLGAAFFALYLRTLCPTVYWYDSAELVTAAVTLGITHPPGYPVYTWLGHLFTWLPLDAAVAVNAMSAAFGAAAVGLVFLLGRRIGLGRGPSAVGAATLGAQHRIFPVPHHAVVGAPGEHLLLPAVRQAFLEVLHYHGRARGRFLGETRAPPRSQKQSGRDQWKNFEAQLGQLQQQLAPAIRKSGY